MSLILEALRKSEAERRRGEAPDLLRNDIAVATTGHARLRAWYWVAAPLTLLPLLLWWSLDGEPSSVPDTVARQVTAPAANAPVAGAAKETLPAVTHLRPAPAPPLAPPPTAPVTTTAPVADMPIADRGPVPLAALPMARRKTLPPLRLSMHLWNEDPARRLAILDGQRVTEGDRIGDAVVAEIRRDGVVLDWNGERILVALP